MQIGIGISLVGGQRVGFSLASLFATASGFDFTDLDVTKTWGPDGLKLARQDGVGTLVTSSGQTVGSFLDKSLNLAVGPELVTNGDFASATGWTKDAGWAISGGKATHTPSASAEDILTTIVNAVGDMVRTKVTVSGRTAGTLSVANPFNDTLAPSSSNGDFIDAGIALAANQARWRASTTFDGSIDDASAKKISGFGASQGTSSSRPTWQANSGKPYLNFDGVDDILQTTLLPSANMTLAACFRAAAATEAVMGASGVISTTDRAFIGVNASGQVAAGLGSDGLSAGPIAGGPDVRGVDVVVLLTYTATTYELWANGQLLKSGAVNGVPTVADAIFVGGFNAHGTASTFLQGRFYGGVALQRSDLSNADKIALMRLLGATAGLSF